MKRLTKLILAFIVILFLSACAVVVHSNIGSDIRTNRDYDNNNLRMEQQYETDMKKEEVRRLK